MAVRVRAGRSTAALEDEDGVAVRVRAGKSTAAWESEDGVALRVRFGVGRSRRVFTGVIAHLSAPAAG